MSTAALFASTASRECWLLALVERARPLFEAAGSPLPATVRVGIGHMTSRKKTVIGECFAASNSGDGTREIWVRPYTTDGLQIAGTLIHELCHAALPEEAQHKAPFAKLARAMKLEGKPTETTIGDAFREVWEPIIAEVGAYPGGVHDRGSEKKSAGSKRPAQVKIECNCCTIKAWITPAMRERVEGMMQCVDVECGGEMFDA